MGAFEALVQDMVTVTFDIDGSLSMSDIADVRPYFGTDGAPIVPLPAPALMTFAMLGGLGIMGAVRKKISHS